MLVLNNANELDKVLPEEQRKAVEQWFASGKKGIVGLHAALVHQTKWPWLNALGGCDFNSDSDFTKAKVIVDPAAKDHLSVKGLPAEFWIEADWTNHDRPVTGLPGFNVLLRVDESTYTPVRDYFKTRGGKPMGADHPIAWTHEPATGGRFFYTEFGHDLRSLSTPFVRQHILEGIKWAAQKPEAGEVFTPLFNGKDLTGWEGDPALWKVEDGVVTGTCSGPERPKHNSFLIWRGGVLKDFELRATIRIIGDNNSGIQYRSRPLPEVGPRAITGYQCDIHPAIEHTGMTYEERGRGIFGLNGMNVALDPDRSRWLIGVIVHEHGSSDGIGCCLK